MMIDPHRLVLLDQQRQGGKGQRAQPGPFGPQPPVGEMPQRNHDPQQHQQRHRERRDPFGPRFAQQRLQDHDQRRQRGIHQPRPVHFHGRDGVDAVLRQVEPALPVHQGAHLDHPQRIVAIGIEGAARLAQHRQRQYHRQDRPGDEYRLQEAPRPCWRPCWRHCFRCGVGIAHRAPRCLRVTQIAAGGIPGVCGPGNWRRS